MSTVVREIRRAQMREKILRYLIEWRVQTGEWPSAREWSGAPTQIAGLSPERQRFAWEQSKQRRYAKNKTRWRSGKRPCIQSIQTHYGSWSNGLAIAKELWAEMEEGDG